MNTSITKHVDTIDDIKRAATMLFLSGFFGRGDQTQKVAEISTKILAGKELGYGPFASQTGIHVVQGKPTLGANLMAAAVKANQKYDYRVTIHSTSECEIEFYQGEEKIGVSSFSMTEANMAGVSNKDNWKKYPRNMLFARAMSNGVRWYCPDVFNGNTVYVPDELGAEIMPDVMVIEQRPSVHVVEDEPAEQPIIQGKDELDEEVDFREAQEEASESFDDIYGATAEAKSEDRTARYYSKAKWALAIDWSIVVAHDDIAADEKLVKMLRTTQHTHGVGDKGPMAEGDYRKLCQTLNGLFGANAHTAILGAMCGDMIGTSDERNLPCAEMSRVAEWLENGEAVGVRALQRVADVTWSIMEDEKAKNN